MVVIIKNHILLAYANITEANNFYLSYIYTKDTV